jgi:hypothetical protein
MVLDVLGCHPLGVHRDNFLFQPRDVFLTLFNDLGRKIGLPVQGHIQINLAKLGFDALFLLSGEVPQVIEIAAFGCRIYPPSPEEPESPLGIEPRDRPISSPWPV